MVPAISRTRHDQRGVRAEIEKWLVLWCRTMHRDISWPQRGRYQCRTCGRSYFVPWVRQERPRSAAPAVPIAATLDTAQTG